MARTARPDGRRFAAGMVVGAFALAALAALIPTGDSHDPPDIRNGRAFIQENLWAGASADFAVWVGTDGAPFVGRLDSDGWEVVDVSTVADNALGAPTQVDRHHVYSIAEDADGYVHVIGNMLAEPLRYIRTTRPGDLSSWVAGTMPGPTDRVTYPRFVQRNDGELLFFHRERRDGSAATVLHSLARGSTEWESVGVIIDGRETLDGPYLHRVAHDPETDVVHLAFTWRGSSDPVTTNDVGYARSSDGGRTWTTADGTPLPKPIRHDEVSTVLNTAPRGSGLLNAGGLALDSLGQPHVVLSAAGGGEPTYLWRDVSGWNTRTIGMEFDGRVTVARVGERVLLLGVVDGKIVTIDPGDISTSTSRREPIPPGWEVVFDGRTMDRGGGVRSLIPDGDEPRIVQLVPGERTGFDR